MTVTREQTAALAVLANGIIPPDERDAGAAAVDAASRIADNIHAGAHGGLYLDGLRAAGEISAARFGKPTAALEPAEVVELLADLRGDAPAFFKQLRMDVCALYLGDPAVSRRIGFPGPSIDTGGYPDFDQPQG